MSTRRHFISQTAAAASAMAFPLVGGAQPKPVRIGVLHPVTGALAYSGQQCREGALMAIEDINKAGGIKSLGGAKIEALLADAQSTPQAGAAEIEKLNEAGVSAVVGAFASAICLATTQAATCAGRDQPDNPSQISFSDTPKSAQVMTRKNSFSGTILTSQTPAKTAMAAAGISMTATFRFPGENWPNAQ